jgi:hypothetical protein
MPAGLLGVDSFLSGVDVAPAVGLTGGLVESFPSFVDFLFGEIKISGISDFEERFEADAESRGEAALSDAEERGDLEGFVGVPSSARGESNLGFLLALDFSDPSILDFSGVATDSAFDDNFVLVVFEGIVESSAAAFLTSALEEDRFGDTTDSDTDGIMPNSNFFAESPRAT